MKYVALLSGGKDSCFNLLHCQKNGHELIAAASLGPENGKGQVVHLDLNFMFADSHSSALSLISRGTRLVLVPDCWTGCYTLGCTRS